MTDLNGPDDSPTLPNLYDRPPVPGPPPAGFWDELRPAPAAPPSPGWYGAAGSAGYSPEDETPGIVIPSSGPDRGARRRGALMAVAGVVLATVVVVLATVVIGPHLGSGNGTTDNVAPPATPTDSSGGSSADSTGSSASSSSPSSPATSPATSPAPATSTKVGATAPKSTAASTTTKTARPSTVTTTKNVGPAGVTTNTVGSGTSTSTTTSSSRPSVITSIIEPTTTTHQAPPNPPPPTTARSSQLDFGVPTREIPCTNGLVVQLASELTPQSFQARVQSLQSQGLVPGDAAAATSSGSCAIFANQSNTYVLYSGPFGDLRDACNDRLSGPYDAYIKGGNPSTAGSFFSCICPARPHRLPAITSVGQSGQWIGELQRMLGAHLKYSVGGLDNSSWGVYTSGTQAAVKRFQADHHLQPNGVVDSNTWAAIQSAGC